MSKTVKVVNFEQIAEAFNMNGTGGGSGNTGTLLGYGQIAVGQTRVPFPQALSPTIGLFLTPISGNIFIGDVLVTKTNGFFLPSDEVTQLAVSDTSGLWLVASKNNKRVSWYAI